LLRCVLRRDVMSTPAVTIREDARVAYAAGLMLQQCAPARDSQLHGVSARLHEYALDNVAHFTPDDAAHSRVHRLPVVDREGRCVAMITRTDVFRPLIPDFALDPLYLQKARKVHPAPAWEGADVPAWEGRDLPAL
jgi:hypothetical protein